MIFRQTSFLILVFTQLLFPQENNKNPWKHLSEKDSVSVQFVFYSEADNHNNGVVGKITNQNNFAINYQFNLIFRSSDEDKTQYVDGFLEARQTKAGSNDSLFWIPFEGGKYIGEVGISDFKVKPFIKENSGKENLPRK